MGDELTGLRPESCWNDYLAGGIDQTVHPIARSLRGWSGEATTQHECSLCGLSKRRPISCSDCPAFQRLQTSRFSIAENPNRCPGPMPTPPLHSRLTSDGVASTCRMHRVNQELACTPRTLSELMAEWHYEQQGISSLAFCGSGSEFMRSPAICESRYSG